MPTKSCQLDVIPMDKLNKVLGGCLPALTHIIKKITRNKPILQWIEGSTGQTTDKKPTVGREKSNYRPVSYLSFYLKVVE